MLYQLFVILVLFPSISCQISCYDCLSGMKRYDYIITADNIPAELYDCSIKGGESECALAVQWFLPSNRTEVSLVVDSRKRGVAPADDTVTVDIALGKTEVTDEIQHSLYYFCSTDKCNGASALKRLLQSLTLKDQLMELKDLLEPSAQFDGNWCLMFANQTEEPCKLPPVADKNNCKQCSTTSTTTSKMNSICASCYTDSIQKEFMGREILFNLTDQTRTEIRMINCRSEHCNEVRTGDLIREKSTIEFDFVRFLNGTSRNSTFSTLHGLLLVLIVLAINGKF